MESEAHSVTVFITGSHYDVSPLSSLHLTCKSPISAGSCLSGLIPSLDPFVSPFLSRLSPCVRLSFCLPRIFLPFLYLNHFSLIWPNVLLPSHKCILCMMWGFFFRELFTSFKRMFPAPAALRFSWFVQLYGFSFLKNLVPTFQCLTILHLSFMK